MSEFLKVIEDHPDLCAAGFGLGALYDGAGNPREARHGEFAESRETLKTKQECFDYAREWLKKCVRVKRVNRFNTSLTLKHDAERHFEGVNIRHGAFIAAAISLGIDCARVPSQPHAVYLAISKKLPA